MNDTWVKLYRKLLEWEWYDDVNTCRLFIHLLLKVNYKDKKWKGIEIKAGEILTGLYKLSQQTKLSVQQVRTSLDKLKSTNEITIKSTSKYSIIQLNNWMQHQQDNNQTNKPVTNEQQTDNKPVTTTKEGKKDKNDKKEISLESKIPPAQNLVEEYFLEKESGKEEAEKFFNYYESNGWKVGKNKMKKWKSAASGWLSRSYQNGSEKGVGTPKTPKGYSSISEGQRLFREENKAKLLIQIKDMEKAWEGAGKTPEEITEMRTNMFGIEIQQYIN